MRDDIFHSPLGQIRVFAILVKISRVSALWLTSGFSIPSCSLFLSVFFFSFSMAAAAGDWQPSLYQDVCLGAGSLSLSCSLSLSLSRSLTHSVSLSKSFSISLSLSPSLSPSLSLFLTLFRVARHCVFAVCL